MKWAEKELGYLGERNGEAKTPPREKLNSTRMDIEHPTKMLIIDPDIRLSRLHSAI